MKQWYDPEEDNREIAETVIEGTHDPGWDNECRSQGMSRSNAGLPPERWSYPQPIQKKLI